MKIIKLFDSKVLDCYDSIDNLPIYNWYKINQSNDFSWLLKNKRIIKEKEKNKLQEVWQNIFEEYIDTFGMNDSLRKILFLKRDIAVLETDFYLTNDRSLKTKIKIKQYELNKLLSTDKKDSFEEMKSVIGKHQGYRIDDKLVTVKEFYSLIKAIEKEVSKEKKKIS